MADTRAHAFKIYKDMLASVAITGPKMEECINVTTRQIEKWNFANDESYSFTEINLRKSAIESIVKGKRIIDFLSKVLELFHLYPMKTQIKIGNSLCPDQNGNEALRNLLLSLAPYLKR
jgi:hypothetical protein